jgi:hypothetical protein
LEVKFAQKIRLCVTQYFYDFQELAGEVSDDNARWEMEDENVKMTQVIDDLAQWSTTQSSPQKWKLPPCGQPISAFGSDSQKDLKMRPQDDSMC